MNVLYQVCICGRRKGEEIVEEFGCDDMTYVVEDMSIRVGVHVRVREDWAEI